jgi:glutamate-1-semialdehyde 2,1-aminomutase
LKSYEEKTKRSKFLYAKAEKVLPAGVSYAIRDIIPHPFYIAEANGAKLTDVDGNIYTDYWMGHGAMILGHAPDKVVKAVAEQIHKGTHYGFAHELEVRLAERIVDMIPSAEMVRYTSSGTEANMYASRLARAYTGRKNMVKIEGGWHGGYDSLHTAVIVEPMMGAAGFLTPEPGYLDGLREICDSTGALLIFDEVITGFRLSPGGAQPFYGIDADVTIIGKIMGGGFPIGAFCGRREIFERLDHRKYPDAQERSFHGGTFTGNPISMVAGVTTLDILKGGKVHKKIDDLGKGIASGLKDIINRSKIEAILTGVGSAFAVHFQKEKPRNAREMARNDTEIAKAYWAHMLARGITYVSPSLPHSFIGEPHTQEDVEEYLSTSEDFFKSWKA